ncbi:TonB-dependent receptor [Massilia sp. Root133]|uniref:TonB-dependent siderophore receptor n=1 Tax=Massilia cellulosiltytica TaxID=2683234 RepID=A0A7X3G2J4_9BURK|nr:MULTISPECIES: TonB-dependent siderophore receptor [Telluria group]KQY01675.1 TonB-dependent receptor [Massilia sp. Root133]KQZ38836.1 TonB-dependent receptor [Massilia sp. Root1485]MVW62520.1 TonB-dependent siderophore receptor [Telluria cellulosilytica]
MKQVLRPLPCLVALACSVWTPVRAEEPAMPEVVIRDRKIDAGSYEVTETNTATKINVPLRDIPQTVNVVPAVVLHDQNALSLQDALQNVPGLSFSVGDGQRDQVTIRGFSAISDQFVDGVRDDALYFRDLSNIERVEVLKGPASVLYGRGSAGGLVNRVTKKPLADPLLEAGVTLGSHGQRRGEFDAGAANDDKDALFRVTGAVEDSTGFRDRYFLRRQALAPSATFKLSPATTLTLQADYLHDKRLADQGVPSYHGRPVDVPVETYFGAANATARAFVQSDVKSATATLDHAFTPDLKLHTVLRAYDYALDRNYTSIGTIKDGANPTVAIGQSHRLRDEDGRYLQNELSQTVDWGTTNHKLLYGVELGRQNKSEVLRSRNNVATYDLFHPVLVDLPVLPDSVATSADNRNRVDIAGLYLQDLVALTPEWKVLAGVRYDHLKQDRDDRTAKNIDLQRTDDTWSPRLGAVYQPTSRVAVYASWNRSFQPIADSFTFRANSDTLKPTQTVNKEAGVKLDLTARSSLTAALFDMTQSNIQVADPGNTNFSLPIGRQRTRGLELSFMGEIAPGWDAIAGYANMRGTIEDSTELTSAGKPFEGNTAALTPRHTFNAWIKHRLDGHFWVAAGGRAESGRYASPDDLTTLPGYGVLQLGAGYDSGKVDVTVTVRNLLNRTYFVSAHSGANDYNLPGEPRTVLVSARYRF